MFEKDYILRLIKDFTDALARIVALKEEGLHDKVLREIDGSLDELLGLNVRLLRMMDAAGIAEMLRDKNQLRVYLGLELEEIDVLRRMNQHEKAENLKTLITQVSQTCIDKHGAPEPELGEVLERLENA